MNIEAFFRNQGMNDYVAEVRARLVDVLSEDDEFPTTRAAGNGRVRVEFYGRLPYGGGTESHSVKLAKWTRQVAALGYGDATLRAERHSEYDCRASYTVAAR